MVRRGDTFFSHTLVLSMVFCIMAAGFFGMLAMGASALEEKDASGFVGESGNFAFSESVNLNGAPFLTRGFTQEDYDELRSDLGTYQPGTNYDKVIDGYHTGLAPPTEEDWRRIFEEDKVLQIGSDFPFDLNSSKDHTDSKYFPPIGGQGAKGSCVAFNMVYYMKTFQEAQEHDWDLSDCKWNNGYYGSPTKSYHDKLMSPDYVYTQLNKGSDGGVNFKSVSDMIAHQGTASFATMPYDHWNYTYFPSEAAWREAPLYRGEFDFYWVKANEGNGFLTLKGLIDSGLCAGIRVNADKYSDLTASDLWKNDTYDGSGTNHANTIVGYDDNFGPYTEDGEVRYGAFKVANSWATGWGGDTNKDGCFWISYECMIHSVKQACFFGDRIGYEPELISLFNLSHDKRKETEIYVGLGDPDEPKAEKIFHPGGGNPGDCPFPNNKMALDITEFLNESNPDVYGEQLYIKVHDTDTDEVGFIDHFSIEHFRDYNKILYNKVVSPDPLTDTIQDDDVFMYLWFNDTTKPQIDLNGTSSEATTGDPFHFVVNATDNINVTQVWVIYSYGQSFPVNKTLTPDTDFFWRGTITVPHLLSSVDFEVFAIDHYGNLNTSGKISIPIMDNDNPDFIDLKVPDTTGTGNEFTIWAKPQDNIAVDNVYTEYRWGEGDWKLQNCTLRPDDSWGLTFTAPDTLEPFECRFTVFDSSGNWNASNVYQMTVWDDDMPVFHEDLSNSTAISGRTFMFKTNVTDNIKVTKVEVDYWIGDNSGTLPLLKDDGFWKLPFFINHTTQSLNYFFRAFDGEGNVVVTDAVTLEMLDIDAPEILEDLTTGPATTGDRMMMEVTASDNIEIDSVWALYLIPGEDWERLDLEIGEEGYAGYITVPHKMGEVRYIFHALDTSGNNCSSIVKTFNILDNDPPEIESTENKIGTEGEILEFNAFGSTDNIGIEEYKWIFTHTGSETYLYGEEVKTIFDEAGFYKVELVIKDAAGLEDSKEIFVEIEAVPEEPGEPEPEEPEEPGEQTTEEPEEPGEPEPEEPDEKDEKKDASTISSDMIMIFAIVGVLLIGAIVVVLVLIKGGKKGEKEEETPEVPEDGLEVIEPTLVEPTEIPTEEATPVQPQPVQTMPPAAIKVQEPLELEMDEDIPQLENESPYEIVPEPPDDLVFEEVPPPPDVEWE